ncbi:unnamed protein product [Brachionus calyciflorus]|uniref:BZIP domain-containing protein n=1 Tax=Brachionus calyciflorus TaxID=104777 RepID=A0A813M6F4_9BILA|nr:unnamed protein product [Brachionus calyciflorus]
MPPNFQPITTSNSTSTTLENTNNNNNWLINQTSISNINSNINLEDTVSDLFSEEFNMSDSNPYIGHQNFDEVFELTKSNNYNQPNYVSHVFESSIPRTSSRLSGIKQEPSFNEDTQSSFTYSNDSPLPVTEKVVNKKNGKEQVYEKWGPIKVRPRQRPAPTLASGRKSKNTKLTPEEEQKREERRKRNREAAEKCKQNREEIVKNLEKNYADLLSEQKMLLYQQDSLIKEKRALIEVLNEQNNVNVFNTTNNFSTNANSSYPMNSTNYAYSTNTQYQPQYVYPFPTQEIYYDQMNLQNNLLPSSSSQATTTSYMQDVHPTSYNSYDNNQWNQ